MIESVDISHKNSKEYEDQNVWEPQLYTISQTHKEIQPQLTCPINTFSIGFFPSLPRFPLLILVSGSAAKESKLRHLRYGRYVGIHILTSNMGASDEDGTWTSPR